MCDNSQCRCKKEKTMTFVPGKYYRDRRGNKFVYIGHNPLVYAGAGMELFAKASTGAITWRFPGGSNNSNPAVATSEDDIIGEWKEPVKYRLYLHQKPGEPDRIYSANAGLGYSIFESTTGFKGWIGPEQSFTPS